MINSQDSDLDLPDFSSFSNLPSSDLGGTQDPSFLASRHHIYEDAGLLGVSASDNIPQLTTVWINERNSPELLPYERSLVEPLIDAIEEQSEYIMENVENKFISMMYQTEIERIKYLLKSYLRTRLWKIERFTLYILRQPNLKQLLSSQEIIYARRYQELIEAHNHDSFLHQLPQSQYKQDEIDGDLKMVVEPNLEAPVFCKVLEEIGHVEITKDAVDLNKDGIYFLRYSDVKEYLMDGKIRLV